MHMKAQMKEIIMKYVFLAAAMTTIIAVLLICIFLFANGVPAMKEIGLMDFLTSKQWSPADVPPSFGILPMIVGSISVTMGAILSSAQRYSPQSLAYYCPRGLYLLH